MKRAEHVKPETMPEMQFATIAERVTGRRGRVRAYLFEIATALVFLVAGVSYLADPAKYAAHSVIGRTVYPFDYAWNVGYIVAAVLITVGLILPRIRWRAVGLIMLGTSLLAATAAAAATDVQLRDLGPLIYAVACFWRAYLVVTLFERYRALGPIGGRAGGPGHAGA